MDQDSSGDQRGGIQVIARAAAVLRALSGAEGGLSLAQIAEIVDLPRSTVQRIVGALQEERLIMANASGTGVRLGPALAQLAASAQQSLTEMLRPALEKLSRQTRETVDLAVLRKNALVFVDQIPGSHRLRAVSSVGESFPLGNTANGKAVLALFSDTEATRMVGDELSPASMATLLVELAEIRQTGVAFDRDQHTVGISAVGVAFDGAEHGVFAISIPTPSARFKGSQAQLVEALDTARKQVAAIL